jgi:ENT domain
MDPHRILIVQRLFLIVLELDAYASIVSAFRAQGELNAGKRKLLQDLCASLSISTERHKAEVRRATNDEKLATVAEQ